MQSVRTQFQQTSFTNTTRTYVFIYDLYILQLRTHIWLQFPRITGRYVCTSTHQSSHLTKTPCTIKHINIIFWIMLAQIKSVKERKRPSIPRPFTYVYKYLTFLYLLLFVLFVLCLRLFVSKQTLIPEPLDRINGTFYTFYASQIVVAMVLL